MNDDLRRVEFAEDIIGDPQKQEPASKDQAGDLEQLGREQRKGN